MYKVVAQFALPPSSSRRFNSHPLPSPANHIILPRNERVAAPAKSEKKKLVAARVSR